MAVTTDMRQEISDYEGKTRVDGPSRILIDCTETFASGRSTGIQRVVRQLAGRAEWLSRKVGIPCVAIITDGVKVRQLPLDALAPRDERMGRLGARVIVDKGRAIWRRYLEPLLGSLSLRLAARRLAWRLFIMTPMRPRRHANNVEIRLQKGDLLLMPDSFWGLTCSVNLAERAHVIGACVVPIIHDIFPITHPELSDRKNASAFKKAFTRLMLASHALLTNSRFTQEEVQACLERQGVRVPPIRNFRLGADPFVASGSGIGSFRAEMGRLRDIYLMVGTIEPRKGHAIVLDAFEVLWRSGSQATLVFVGRVGWRCEDLRKRIESHALLGERLFVFYDATDAELHYAYSKAKVLIIASRVEGFGLPLVEAMRYGIRVIASDIEVFREIGGDYPEYFDVDDTDGLCRVLDRNEQNANSASRSPRYWPDWNEAALGAIQAALEVCSGRAMQDASGMVAPNC